MYSTSPLEASGKPARSVIEALAQSNSKWPVVEPNGGLPAIVSPMNVCGWDPAMRSESPTYPVAGPDQGIRFDTSNVAGSQVRHLCLGRVGLDDGLELLIVRGACAAPIDDGLARSHRQGEGDGRWVGKGRLRRLELVHGGYRARRTQRGGLHDAHLR